MASWPRIIPSNLRIDLLQPYIISILTFEALTEGRSHTNSSSFIYPPEHDSFFSFEHFQRKFSNFFGHVSILARQRETRILAGQIGFWDMGLFVMACGLIQSIRIWKKRRQTREEDTGLSNRSIGGVRQGRENIRASLDDSGNLRKGECGYLVQ